MGNEAGLKRAGAVSEIWRYPVAGLRGESLKRARILDNGISGDRGYQLRDQNGKILGPFPQQSSPTERSILGLGASIDETGEGGVLRVTSEEEVMSLDRPDFALKLDRAVGVRVRLEESTTLATRAKRGRAIHVISDSSIRALKRAYPGGDFDVRRFRPNIVLEMGRGAEDFTEEGWVGRSLKIGDAALRVERPNERCAVTTLPQGNLPADKRILETISDANDGSLGVMCSVERSGAVAVGDSVFLDENLPATATKVF
jgi:MOSC domain-containing protein